MPTANSIFVSYRRSDSNDVTGRIYDFLTNHFGRDVVFKDVDSIPLGVDFRTHLNETVGRCKVLIAVIGPTWLEVLQERLGQPAIDWVRAEIETALGRGIPVIPLLVGGARLPGAADLPESLQDLAYRNAAQTRPDPDFKSDMDRLIQELEAIVGVVTGSTSSFQMGAGALQVPTELSGDEYGQLLDALKSAFVDEEALSLMVRRMLRQRLNSITQGASTYEATVDRLIEWAESHGRLQDLMEGALQGNPENPKLKALARAWWQK